MDTNHPLAAVADASASNSGRQEVSEARAKHVSSQIDNAIKAEQTAMKKSKKPVKVLLLGQSESGKTTIIKSTSPVKRPY